MKDYSIYLKPTIHGPVDSEVIPFVIDGFESETTISFIYNNEETIQKTQLFNDMNHSYGFPLFDIHHIVIAEDIGGSPIILDAISGRVYLSWFDFDGELALLFEDLELFYNSLLLI
jgi:hypothetical protein